MDGFANKPLEPARLMQEIARVLGHGEWATPAEGSAQQPGTPPEALYPTPAPEPAKPGTDAVDWSQGMRLWGAMTPLRDALQRFLRDHASAPAAMRHLLETQDLVGLRSLAHRLHGAAGNLAMPGLRSLLGAIEGAIEHRDTSVLEPMVSQLEPELVRVRKALEAEVRSAASPAPADSPALQALSPRDREDALEALRALSTALKRSELDAAPLQTLLQLLPPDATRHLQDALDAFDFDTALVVLQSLSRLIAQDMTEPTP